MIAKLTTSPGPRAARSHTATLDDVEGEETEPLDGEQHHEQDLLTNSTPPPIFFLKKILY